MDGFLEKIAKTIACIHGDPWEKKRRIKALSKDGIIPVLQIP